MHVEKISFETIKPFWAEHMWPGRQSPIESISCIDSEGEIDMTIRRFQPHFWGAFQDSELVGVISFCMTSHSEARLRGICVHPTHRGQDISIPLFQKGLEEISAVPTIRRIWAMSRTWQMDYFLKLGFTPGIEVSQYEFGPHNIMFLDLKK